MAVEASVSGMQTVQPVQRPSSNNTGTIQPRTGSSGAGFTPETNVDIKNSVQDMSEVLSKVSATETAAEEQIPQNVQQLVDKILSKGLSLENTISQGLGSTVESQRFTAEQLNTLSRILTQLGELSETNSLGTLSDELGALLRNIKGFMDGNTGSSLETVLINKAAFQLLDAKGVDSLPAVLQQMLSKNIDSAQGGAQGINTAGLNALKQVIQSLMPQNHGNAVQTNVSANIQSPLANNTVNLEGNAAGTVLQQTANPQGVPTAQNITVTANMGSTVQTANVAKTVTGNSQSVSTPQTQQGAVSSNTASVNTAAAANNTNAVAEPLGQNNTAFLQSNNGAVNANTGGMIQNTPQTMQAMKDLGALLLKDAALTPKDTQLLQNFVNGKETVLSASDAKQLQQLVSLSEKNIPAVVRQAAQQQNMTDLSKLWAFMQLCDLSTVDDLHARELKAAGRRVAKFAISMRAAMQAEHAEPVDGQRSMSFMMPIYMGDSEKSVPAYIHIYVEEKEPDENGKSQKETWMRLCVLMENIGAVDLTCCLYEGKKLNMRLMFSDSEATEEFKEFIPEIRTALHDSSVDLTGIKLGTAGE